jgi:Leucine-rich repeat (LRR) protein
LKDLQDLKLHSNKLTSVPKETGTLRQLKSLNLAVNKLASVPKEIGNLEHLKILFLNVNQLTLVPKEIGNLEQLTYLYLNNNQLTSVPKEIGNLEQLRSIWISRLPVAARSQQQHARAPGRRSWARKILNYAWHACCAYAYAAGAYMLCTLATRTIQISSQSS